MSEPNGSQKVGRTATAQKKKIASQEKMRTPEFKKSSSNISSHEEIQSNSRSVKERRIKN